MNPYLLMLSLSLGLLTAACGATNVPCDSLGCDDGNACTADSCNPETASCQSAPVSNGTSCRLDTALGACEAGVCTAVPCVRPGGCGFPTMGSVEVTLQVATVSPAEVLLEATCEGWAITARFFIQDDGSWRLVGPLPTGACTGRFIANDEGGMTLCTSDVTFDVNPTTPTKIDTQIACSIAAP